MEQNHFRAPRNSQMLLGEVYFWTDTIKGWRKLLKPHEYKAIIINQLQWLVSRKKVAVYGYVIMPNHIHLIWEMLEKNGKEMPHASFNKWTSSAFLKDIQQNHPQVLPYFIEQTNERNHRFWQRDPLAILLDSKAKLEQKLDYLHLNPLHKRWQLATAPEDYPWSSAKYYLTGEDEFNILTDYREECKLDGGASGLSGDRPGKLELKTLSFSPEKVAFHFLNKPTRTKI
ncbi:transposase [Adhaeribacter soli]|uniref:transposase n=1 Tax=Adhaeribacter soli TaxID=2607655 RepID=UPI001783AC5E|nr:transposase [Adhaeribacter soli]